MYMWGPVAKHVQYIADEVNIWAIKVAVEAGPTTQTHIYRDKRMRPYPALQTLLSLSMASGRKRLCSGWILLIQDVVLL